jgi:hypothetical protein
MIRFCLAAAAALLATGCSKAPEDVTARYALAGGQGNATVKAAGNGDARLDSGGQTLIRKGGTEYLLSKDSQGSFAAKVSDFTAVMGEMMQEGGMKRPPMPPQPEFELVKAGKENIAGLEGDVWKIRRKGTPNVDVAEAVITADPAYAKVGEAMQMQTRLGMESVKQLQGELGTLEKRVEEMLGKGTVLRFGPMIKLDKIERGPIDASSFALPDKVLDKAALKTRLEAERVRMQAMQRQSMQGGAPGAPGQIAPAPQPAPGPRP